MKNYLYIFYNEDYNTYIRLGGIFRFANSNNNQVSDPCKTKKVFLTIISDDIDVKILNLEKLIFLEVPFCFFT